MYNQNIPLLHCTIIKGSLTSDSFYMLEIWLKIIIPKLGGKYIELEELIKSLIVKNKESFFYFHSREK